MRVARLTSSIRPRMGTSLSELELSELSALRFFRWTGFFGGGFLFKAPPGIVWGIAREFLSVGSVSISHMMLGGEIDSAAVRTTSLAGG